jgi:hypothetical protein
VNRNELSATDKVGAESQPKRAKVNYIGAPACFRLEQGCQLINRVFGGYGCYLVGSALERADWRDIDIRCIMADELFAEEFPGAGQHWEHNPRWLFMATAVSEYLSKISGLPIDFQFQPQTHANERHQGTRSAIGLEIADEN